MEPDAIKAGVEAHFVKYPPCPNRDTIIKGFLDAFKQNAGLISSEESALDDATEEDGSSE
jgi:hypothetical protein